MSTDYVVEELWLCHEKHFRHVRKGLIKSSNSFFPSHSVTKRFILIRISVNHVCEAWTHPGVLTS